MKLLQSLFILHNHIDVIDHLSELMVGYNLTMLDPVNASDKEIQHYLALYKTSLIEICSFLEEYQDNFEQLAEPIYKERIRFVKTALSPVTRKIANGRIYVKSEMNYLLIPGEGKAMSSYMRIFSITTHRAISGSYKNLEYT